MALQRFLPFLALPLFVAASCGGGGGSGGGSFLITACSLGCTGSGPGGVGQVSCGIQDVFVNGELRITFSSPINESSLTVFSVQVTEFASGTTPAADRFVDPADPNVLVYRPKLTFDSAGTPVFGLTGGSTYTIKLPGVVEDSVGPYVTNVNGTPNRHRMLCTVEASLGILDAKPGSPTVSVTVDKVTGYDPVTGDPNDFAFDVPADGAVDVFRFTDITLVFDDVMNPATLVNPVTGESSSITVSIDPDGDTSDTSDQQPINGSFSIDLDQDALTTRVVFTPELGFPSAGSDPVTKRVIVVGLGSAISDLAGNSLTNPDPPVFTPEVLSFQETTLLESFDMTDQLDGSSTSADWGDAVPGALLAANSGGSGRLGELTLVAGQVVTLNTDFEDFAGIDPTIFNPASVLDATFDGSTFTVAPVTDGVFEFSFIDMEPGSLLKFEGTQPARLFVRGDALLFGSIDASGPAGTQHSSSSIFGGMSPTPMLTASAGGDGGRLPTWEGFETVAGTVVPPDPKPPAPTLPELNGQVGTGAIDNLFSPTGNYGGGGGGFAWPQPGVIPDDPTTPTFNEALAHLPEDLFDLSGLQFDLIFLCQTKMKGGVGAGGAYGLDGEPGNNLPIPGGSLPAFPPDAVPGSASDFGLGFGIGSDPDSEPRKLSPEDGWLHGGSGGGGGGSHVALSDTNGMVFFDCLTAAVGQAQFKTYIQHSSAGGGAGGGAMQVQSGRRTVLDGVLLTTGGTGGRQAPGGGQVTAGGGGSGGALLVQAPTLQVAPIPGRLDFDGGMGGPGSGGSLGGQGGPGLLRVETDLPLLDINDLATKTLPDDADLAAKGASPSDVISIGELELQEIGPGALSGAQSCWIQPSGNFFTLTFIDDDTDPGTGDLIPAWDAKLILPSQPDEQSFRGENDVLPGGVSFETVLGNILGVSPMVIRFQGARAITAIESLCEVPLAGPDSVIQEGSLTGWVKHPAELNDYFGDPSLRSNMIRFQIVLDRTNDAFFLLDAVGEVSFKVLPD